ncbi:MAG: hypothetical protein IT160_02865 [Bryobacterales bacterium]|nr:hypothetical protein [Bryobacterales bacterium]
MSPRHLLYSIALSLALTAGLTAAGKPFPEVARVGPDVFPVLAWGSSPADPQQLRMMKEAGLNVSGFCKVEDLDRVAAAGLTCIVSDPVIAKIVARNEATDAEIREAAAALAKRIGSNRTAFGVNLRDEPSEQQMPILGRLAAELLRVMPDKLPYVNLFPNYASNKQLGSPSYEDHLRAYLNIVKLPYLSWDNYSVEDGEMLPRFYDNLEVARKLTLEAKIPFWNCILSTAMFDFPQPDDAIYSLQIYATMAYGGRGIELFTYFSEDIGNFRLAPIDHWGNRTSTYDALRRAALQIHALAPTLARLHSTGVYHWPVSTAAGTQLLKGIGTSGRLLVGEFSDDQGRPWVMLVNKSLTRSCSFHLSPRAEKAKLYRLSAVTGEERPLGEEGNWLAPGSGMLLRIAAE